MTKMEKHLHRIRKQIEYARQAIEWQEKKVLNYKIRIEQADYISSTILPKSIEYLEMQKQELAELESEFRLLTI